MQGVCTKRLATNHLYRTVEIAGGLGWRKSQELVIETCPNVSGTSPR